MSQQSIKHQIHNYFSFLANIVTLFYIFKTVYFQVNNIYNIDNFAEKLLSWFEMWAQTTQPSTASKSNSTLTDLRKDIDFLPAIRKAPLIALPFQPQLVQLNVHLARYDAFRRDFDQQCRLNACLAYA